MQHKILHIPCMYFNMKIEKVAFHYPIQTYGALLAQANLILAKGKATMS